MKKSLYPYGVLALTELIAWFPSILGQLVMMWVVSKATLIISNVPGPKEPLNYHGNVKSKALVVMESKILVAEMGNKRSLIT